MLLDEYRGVAIYKPNGLADVEAIKRACRQPVNFSTLIAACAMIDADAKAHERYLGLDDLQFDD